MYVKAGEDEDVRAGEIKRVPLDTSVWAGNTGLDPCTQFRSAHNGEQHLCSR